jgi:exodeoxyribonuclease VII large subunit
MKKLAPEQGDLFVLGRLQPPAEPPEPPAPPKRQAPPSSASQRPERTVLSVGELTRQIKQTVEPRFARVLVRGEVSGFRGPNARGHLYFALKDEAASIDAKMWASQAARLRFNLKEGLSVVAEGSVDLYEPQGRYSLIVQRLEPEGQGALALAFEQLKERLAAEGLFSDKRKRPLPFLPRRIGVVTSRTGAALQDFLRVLHGRNPRLSVLVCDSRVQGEGAAEEVVGALRRLARTDVDVIVVTRGGGSVEDLWTFNEEQVARAIAASPVPVVSAVGHEVDFTIADFVADWRAATPSAAAERLAPVLDELLLRLADWRVRLRQAVGRRVLELRGELRQLSGQLEDPRRRVSQERLRLGEAQEAMERVLRPALRVRREALRELEERLQRARPQARLAQQRARLNQLEGRLKEALRVQVATRRAALARARLGLERASPASRVNEAQSWLAASQARLEALERQALAHSRGRLQQLAARLEALSPLQVMSRGYSVVLRKRDGAVVRSAEQVQPGELLAIRLAGNGARTLQECEEVEASVTAVRTGPGSG